MKKKFYKEVLHLNKKEKFMLMDALWDSIASPPKIVDLPAPQKVKNKDKLQSGFKKLILGSEL